MSRWGRLIRLVRRAAIVALAAGVASASAADANPDIALGRLLIPVEGVAAAALVDSFDSTRDGHRHESIDIAAARGTRVLAVDDGTVVKLFLSRYGGLTLYQFDTRRRFAYYYAHLDRYAPGLTEGMSVRRGALLGYVGTTGNAPPEAPHLHFAVFRLEPEPRWWKGVAVNPYPAFR